MSMGRLIAVVGPSGVGKDTVMAGLLAACPALTIAKRVITRAADAAGEDFAAVSEAAFGKARDRGDFVLHWRAHGLFYGIPHKAVGRLAGGQDVLANLSRRVLAQAQAAFPGMEVLSLTASDAVLAARLAGRGRETPADITARLARVTAGWPVGLMVHQVGNDGPVGDAVAAALAALYPDRG